MKRRQKVERALNVILALVVLFGVLAIWRPTPAAKASAVDLQLIKARPVQLPWPTTGQAAYGTVADGLLASSGPQTPVPTASVAKVITALAVLHQKPLNAGSQDPTITLGPADVAIYNQYYSEDGSVVAVASGEQISEYQALEAVLLPSANNMAYSVAVWAFGSLDNYVNYANSYVKSLGMSHTHVADASGFSPQTVSTADDLVKLAQAALANPVLTQIVGQEKATIPVAGTIRNINWLLGNDGVIGIKTGNTDQAGGCFLFAAKRTVWGKQITAVGAILGDTTLNKAVQDGDNLIVAADRDYRPLSVKAGQVVATYKMAWGVSVSAAAQKPLNLVVWQSWPAKVSLNLKPVRAPQKQGAYVGPLSIRSNNQSATVPVVLKTSVQKPPISWRIRHL